MDNEDLNWTIGKSINLKLEDSLTNIHEHNLNYKTNTIYLFGNAESEIDAAVSEEFIKNLSILIDKPGNDPILIRMSLNGGTWEDGMSIYDSIITCPKKVIILCYGTVASMASIILCAAEKRVMMPSSWFMFHRGTFKFEGLEEEHDIELELKKQAEKRMFDIYSSTLKNNKKFSRWSKERIIEHLRKKLKEKIHYYLTAQEAVKWGFADEVFDADWKKLLEID